MADSASEFLGAAPPPKPSKSSATQFLGDRMKATSAGGRRMGGRLPQHDYPALPFMHRTVLAAVDKEDEQDAYLSKVFPGSKVSSDKRGRVLTTADGQKMRLSTGLAAETVAQAPELALGGLGAVSGAAAGGPIGAVAGAAAGGMAGKAIKEAAKSAAGIQRQTPGEIVKSTERAGEHMGEAEVGGRMVTKALSRVTRGPLPKWVTGKEKPVPEEDVRKLTAKGAKLHPATWGPEAVGLQRRVIIADAITKNTGGRDKANMDILKFSTEDILKKVKIAGSEKKDIVGRLSEPGPQMSFQEVGRTIQQNAAFKLQQLGAAAKKSKTAEYLRQLSNKGMTPEQSYSHLVKPGETDRLERVFTAMGPHSPLVASVRRQELKNVLAGALTRAKNGEITGVLESELDKYTPKQLKLLFPNGLDKDLRLLSKEAQDLFPHVADPGIASITIGGILNKPYISPLRIWRSRVFPLAYYSLWRAVLQNPESVRVLALGLKGSGPARQAARATIHDIIFMGIMNTDQPGEQEQEGQPQQQQPMQPGQGLARR